MFIFWYLFTRVGQPTSLHCDTVCGGRIREETMPLTWLSAGFQLLSLLPISKLGPSDADFQVGGFMYIVGPCGSLQWTLLWVWEFLLLLQSSQVFIARGFEALFAHTRTLGCVVCLAPQLFLLDYLCTNMGLPSPLATALSWVLPALAVLFCPSYQSGWMFSFNSLVVRLPYSLFFGSSGYFFFLNLLLSFFWLCEETKCSYLGPILAGRPDMTKSSYGLLCLIQT